jgi:hypothetical protein
MQFEGEGDEECSWFHGGRWVDSEFRVTLSEERFSFSPGRGDILVARGFNPGLK